MYCPNGHEKFVIGPEYGAARSTALMTCLQCGVRFDAYALYGEIQPKTVRKAA